MTNSNHRAKAPDHSESGLPDLKKLAIDECLGLLDGIESVILELEKEPYSRSTIDEFFRRVHTIKSNIAFIENTDVQSRYLKNLETTLDVFRQSEIRPNKAAVDTFLKSGDFIKRLILCVSGQEAMTHDLMREANRGMTDIRRLALIKYAEKK